MPTAVLFGDGDEDQRRRIWVSSVQIRSGWLSHGELRALGGATVGGIPLASSTIELPRLSCVRSSDGTLTLSWSPDPAVTLESAGHIEAAVWVPVSGVSGSSVTLPLDEPVVYYRLRK